MSLAVFVQSVPIAPPVDHFRHPIVFHLLLWIFLFLGMAVNIIGRAWVVASSKNSPVSTIRGFLGAQWGPVVVRDFLLCCAFGAWTFHPDDATKLAQYLASKLSGGSIQEMLLEFGIPLNFWTAGTFGYLGDSILDKILTRFPGIASFLHIPTSKGAPANAPETEIK